MKIQILGTGCSKCKLLYNTVEKTVKEKGITQCEIEKIEDIQKIIALGVISTPALIIDGKVVASGKTLSLKEIQTLL